MKTSTLIREIEARLATLKANQLTTACAKALPESVSDSTIKALNQGLHGREKSYNEYVIVNGPTSPLKSTFRWVCEAWKRASKG